MKPVPGSSGKELLAKEVDVSEADFNGDNDWTGKVRTELVKVGARILAAAMTSPAEIDAAIEAYELDPGEDPAQGAQDCFDFLIKDKVERILIMIWGLFDTDAKPGGEK